MTRYGGRPPDNEGSQTRSACRRTQTTDRALAAFADVSSASADPMANLYTFAGVERPQPVVPSAVSFSFRRRDGKLT